MKRFTALVLALALLCSLTACGGTGNETHDYSLHLLEEGQYDMAIHVILGLRDMEGGVPAPRNLPDWEQNPSAQFPG